LPETIGCTSHGLQWSAAIQSGQNTRRSEREKRGESDRRRGKERKGIDERTRQGDTIGGEARARGRREKVAPGSYVVFVHVSIRGLSGLCGVGTTSHRRSGHLTTSQVIAYRTYYINKHPNSSII
jgi:hypothetical protein